MQSSPQPACPAFQVPSLSLTCQCVLQQVACLGTWGVRVQVQDLAGAKWYVWSAWDGALLQPRQGEPSPGMSADDLQFSCRDVSETPGSFLCVSSSSWTSQN